VQDANMQTQIELEKLYSKNQLLPRLYKYFEEEFKERNKLDLTKFMKINKIDIEFGFSLLVQMALHRRTTLPTMIGILRHHYPDAQAVADAILKCCEVDLLHWHPAYSQLVVEPTLTIPEDIQRELDLYQFPLPMVVKPKEVKCNRDTGYILNRGSIILKKNHHEKDVCLDHINHMNSLQFTINIDTANMIANSWRNLDKPKQGETKEDFERRKRAFEKYDRSCHEVIAKLVDHGNKFYLTHKYDKRGRVYCQGYHINYQGAPWNKAVIELAESEYVQL
jgi:hypothetical protein